MNFKYFFCSILILWQLAACNSSAVSDCQQFRNGKFQLIDKQGNFDSIIIERNETTQKENITLVNETTEFNVKWINDCTAHLTFKSGKHEMKEFFKDKILVMQIEEIDLENQTYVFSQSFRGDNKNKFYQKAKRVD